MDDIFEDVTDCKRILREITLMRLLKHSQLVQLKEVIYPRHPASFKSIYLVMNFAESDLKKIIKSSLNLELLHIKTIVYNLLCAVKFLHDSKVVHRDIKPANILLNEDCSVHLCDYGLARSLVGIQESCVLAKRPQASSSSDEDATMESKSDRKPLARVPET